MKQSLVPRRPLSDNAQEDTDAEAQLSFFNQPSSDPLSDEIRSVIEDMDINKSSELPITLTTEFTSITLQMMLNESTGLPILNATTGFPIFIPIVTEERVNLTIREIFDSRRPGIGASYRGILYAYRYGYDTNDSQRRHNLWYRLRNNYFSYS